LSLEDGKVFLKDGSTNGTSLNGELLEKGKAVEVVKEREHKVVLSPGKAKSVTLTLEFPAKESNLKRAKVSKHESEFDSKLT
jgi:hypothetical protein